MKTLLFAPLFLDGEERYIRNIQWIDYIMSIKPHLKFDEIYYVDNASNPDLLECFEKHINQYQLKNFIYIEKCKTRLLRNSDHGYGYWYSAFGKAVTHASLTGFSRIVHIDTDVYLLDKDICTRVNNLITGWTCFWSEMHQYPESTFQVIGKDQYKEVYEFMTRDFLKFYPNGLAELEIPWTNVIKEFKGDRYGEKNLEQTPDMDYYAQKPNDIKLKFNE